MYYHLLGRSPSTRIVPATLAAVVTLAVLAPAKPAAAQAIIKKLQSGNEQVELSVNSSRILTLDARIPRAQVNNPEILAVTPLSPNQIQISAKAPGVTQVNLWDEKGNIYTVDCLIYGDARELELALKTHFPHSSVKVYRHSNSLVLTGFVDRPDHVSTMVRLAEDYAPKVINNISVGGVQQILLHVKVMEVSRTKLRKLGIDFAVIEDSGYFASRVSGLIGEVNVSPTGGVEVVNTNGQTVEFLTTGSDNAFFAFIDALRQHDLMKILAEPTLVTVSGRPASFNVGGEFPVLVPQSLGTVSIEYKKFGTQVDFVPLVLGNGNIRLEVRPRVSEIDSTRSVVVADTTVPGLRVREIDTGVEMKAGQTLAIAGLIQNRMEAQNKGLPLLADLPVVGAMFRTVMEVNNEIELLIMVRPEFVDAMDAHEVPQGGPGLNTRSPNNHELMLKGFLEVPRCCGDGNCQGCLGGDHANCVNGNCPIQHGQPVGPPVGPPVAPVPPHVESVVPQPQAAYRGVRPAPRYALERPSVAARRYAASVAQPTYVNNPQNRYQEQAVAGSAPTGSQGFIGPVGYEAKK